MKVQLINVADYELDVNKTSKIPLRTFVNLVKCDFKSGDIKPTVRLFKTQEDFKNLTKEQFQKLDFTQDVHILNNGQFLVFLKTEENVTTNTKEDKAGKSESSVKDI